MLRDCDGYLTGVCALTISCNTLLSGGFMCVSVEDSLLRQDDIWMLDDPQEPRSRAPRPDHLDFLRITPPEDDIIGDSPYCPGLERTVRPYKCEL